MAGLRGANLLVTMEPLFHGAFVYGAFCFVRFESINGGIERPNCCAIAVKEHGTVVVILEREIQVRAEQELY